MARTRPTVLAIDQGTSSTKALLVDTHGRVIAGSNVPVGRTSPGPGWIEQSADELWESVGAAVRGCLDGIDADVIAVGLSNQRESLLVWDRATGRPCSPVLSWQDQRGAAVCEDLLASGHGPEVRAISGLPLDPMFSAAKATWLLENVDRGLQRGQHGDLCLGTIDSWVVFRLTGEHVIEVGNASRTQLLDITSGQWSPALLDLFRIPEAALPRVLPSSGPFPPIRGLAPLADGTPLTAVMGDSHAALFAHAGWRRGTVKATYGTGSSVMAAGHSLAADEAVCATIAWESGERVYAAEGNIRSSGDTLVWLGDLFGLPPAEIARLAEQSDSGGVHLVPAFSGLGAPWWDRDAVALVSGLRMGTSRHQLARAALEAIAFQVEDVVAAIERCVGPISVVLADGGASANRNLMQLQADLSGRVVQRSAETDLSALGVAHLAGEISGIWSRAALDAFDRPMEEFKPREPESSRRERQSAWHLAVARSRH